MSEARRRQYPFKLRPCDAETQQKIARDFRGYPNGLQAINHWDFLVSATASEEELEQLYNFPVQSDDVWVVTPPKNGTTWCQEMVWLLANDLDYSGAAQRLNQRYTFLDELVLQDREHLARLEPAGVPCTAPPQGRRFIKTHLPLSTLPPHLLHTCKIFYVARNPKDAVVSYYHHNRLMRYHDFVGDFPTFLEHFLNGTITLLPMVPHVIEAWERRHHPNMCFLFYEEMKADLPAVIRRCAEFLGKQLTDQQVHKLTNHLSFDSMSNNSAVNYEEHKAAGTFYTDRGSFMRRGETGDWKNYMTPELSDKVDKWLAEQLRATDLRFL